MKYWSRYPVFRFLIPFGAGILINIYASIVPVQFLVPVLVFYLMAAGFTFRNWATGRYAHRWLAGIPFYALYFCLGVALSWLHTSSNHTHHFAGLQPQADRIISLVKTVPVKTFSGWRFEASVKSVRVSDRWESVRGNLMVGYRTVDSVAPVSVGDLIVTSAIPEAVKPSSNPGAFDYAFYLSVKGIYHRCFTDSLTMQVLEKSSSFSVIRMAVTVRSDLLNILRNRVPGEEELGVAGALLLGYEGWLDPEVENNYAMSGVLHILCVSGMHVGLLYMILGWLFSPLNRIKWLRHLRFTMVILIIWFYALITGFAPSIVRAATMFTFVLAGQWLNRPNGMYNTLCASCFFMFLFDPFMMVAPGFQLSFLAVLGIVVLQRPLLELWQPDSRILFKIWELAAVSIAAQLATAPLSMYLFHQFPNYFLMANMVAVPLTTLGMYIGLFLFTIDWFEVVGSCTGTVLSLLIKLVNEVIAFFGALPGAITEGISLSLKELLLLYLMGVLIFFWLKQKSYQYLFSSMIVCILYLTFRIVFFADQHHTVSLVVYQVRGAAAVSVTENQHALLLTDSAFRDHHYNYSVKGHFTENRVKQVNHILMKKRETIWLREQKILCINDFTSNDSIGLIKPEVLILSGKYHPDIEAWVSRTKPGKVVLTSSFRMWKGAEVSRRWMQAGISVHDVTKDGAYLREVPLAGKITQ